MSLLAFHSRTKLKMNKILLRLEWQVSVCHPRDKSTHYSKRMHGFSISIINKTSISISIVSFSWQLDSGNFYLCITLLWRMIQMTLSLELIDKFYFCVLFRQFSYILFFFFLFILFPVFSCKSVPWVAVIKTWLE